MERGVIDVDKGIFYLVCSFVLLGALGLVGLKLAQKVDKQCVGKTVVERVVVVATPAPTASPSAALKPSLKLLKK